MNPPHPTKCLKSVILVTILSYYLLIPIYATHFVFVKSGVTTGDETPIQEEEMERISRFVGIDVHLHMHHSEQQQIQTDEEVPIAEQQAPIIDINDQMTMTEIDTTLFVTVNNLQRFVPPYSVDLQNLKTLIEKLQKKIEKCNSDASSSDSSSESQEDAVDENERFAVESQKGINNTEQNHNESKNVNNVNRTLNESQSVSNLDVTDQSQNTTNQNSNQVSQNTTNTTETEHTPQETNKQTPPNDASSEQLPTELDQLQKVFNEEIDKGVNGSQPATLNTGNETNITNTSQQSEEIKSREKPIDENTEEKNIEEKNKIPAKAHGEVSNSSSVVIPDTVETNPIDSPNSKGGISIDTNTKVKPHQTTNDKDSDKQKHISTSDEAAKEARIIQELEKLASMLDFNETQKKQFEHVKKQIQAGPTK